MAYDKYTWVNGELITAEKLNHIEDGIIDNGPGYECTETVTELFNETVTAAKQSETTPYAQVNLAYSQQITADMLIVTYDGVEYLCNSQPQQGDIYYYGASSPADFGQYPFVVFSSPTDNILYAQTEGEHTIKASTASVNINSISPGFKRAVDESLESSVEVKFSASKQIGFLETSTITYESQYTAQQLYYFMNQKKINATIYADNRRIEATGIFAVFQYIYVSGITFVFVDQYDGNYRFVSITIDNNGSISQTTVKNITTTSL